MKLKTRNKLSTRKLNLSRLNSIANSKEKKKDSMIINNKKANNNSITLQDHARSLLLLVAVYKLRKDKLTLKLSIITLTSPYQIKTQQKTRVHNFTSHLKIPNLQLIIRLSRSQRPISEINTSYLLLALLDSNIKEKI